MCLSRTLTLQNPTFCSVLIMSLGFHCEFLQYTKILIDEQETYSKDFMPYNYLGGDLGFSLTYEKIVEPHLLSDNLL